MNFWSAIILVIAIGIFMGVVRYIVLEKSDKGVSYGKLLVNILLGKGYVKASMPNEFPVYVDELEKKDTEEYLELISADILNLIK